jgi:hypothetical protein
MYLIQKAKKIKISFLVFCMVETVASFFPFRYVLLLYHQRYGIFLEAALVASKNADRHHGHGQCFGIGLLHFHGYLHCTQAYFQLGFAYG